MWISFRSGRRLTSSDRLGRYRQRPEPSRTQNAVACTQCAVRSVRFQRWTVSGGAVAIRPAHPRVLVVAEPFPVTGRLVGDELDPRQPLDALVAVHLRDNDAGGRTVPASERCAAPAE